MKQTSREKELRLEIEDIRLRLEEAVETLSAIRRGEVDALVVSTEEGEQVFTLKGAEHPYRVMLEALNEGVLTTTSDGTIMYSNSRFAEMLQIPLQKVIGSSIWGFVPETDRPAFAAILDQGRTGTGKGETLLRTGGKALLPVHLAVNPLEIEEVSALCIVAVDLTGQKRIEKELRDLSSRLLTAHEEERRRISHEIHDGLGIHLSTIKFRMDTFFKQMPGLSKEIFTAIEEAANESRRIQMDLHPSILEDLGIEAALSWFFRKLGAARPDLRIEQDIDLDENRVPESLKMPIYRICQEAFNNIAKHSKADLARISLQAMDNTIELKIQDNGEGFDPSEVLSPDGSRKGLGLISMRERAKLSGGFCRIESRPEKGTTVYARWPIES